MIRIFLLLVATSIFSSATTSTGEGGPQQSTTVEVDLTLHRSDTGETPNAPVSATVEALWYGRDAETGRYDPVTVEVIAGRPSSVSLPEGPWVLRARADGYWGDEAHVPVSRATREVALGLWPSSTIAGRLALPRERMAPETVWIFTHPAPDAPADAPPAAKLHCPVTDLSWTCQGPAGRRDLRFQVDGYVPIFRWDEAIQPGRTLALGAMPLVPGGSVHGWVETADGRPLSHGGSVTLTPDAACLAERTGERERLAGRSFRTSIDERGFFQLGAVPPGSYVIEARAEPFATARGPVRVVEGQATQISHPPLVLDLPETLEVLLDPPVDPDGEPWRVALFRMVETGAGPAQLGEAVAAGPAELAGWWEHGRLERGLYNLEVRSGREAWYRSTIEIDDDPPPVQIDLHGVPAEGRVTLGGEPLQATLTFKGPEGVLETEATSDAEGEFSALFSQPGSWTAVVIAEEPQLRRTVRGIEVALDDPDEPAVVEIELVDSTLTGRVITEDEAPVADARIQARSLATGVIETARTDEEGRFELRGLDEGRFDLRARGRNGLESATLTVEVGGEPPDEERTLVLRQRVKVSGTVLSDAGSIPGATVTVTPIDRATLGTPILITDARGRFEAPLPAGTGQIQVTVGAPGFALRMVRMPLPQDGQIPVRVDQAAGTLVLDLGEAMTWFDADAPAFTVTHGQASAPLPSLLRWAAQNGVAPELPVREVEIPWMEPGSYALCWAPRGAGGKPASGAQSGCVEGHLAVSGRLELSRSAGLH